MLAIYGSEFPACNKTYSLDINKDVFLFILLVHTRPEYLFGVSSAAKGIFPYADACSRLLALQERAQFFKNCGICPDSKHRFFRPFSNGFGPIPGCPLHAIGRNQTQPNTI